MTPDFSRRDVTPYPFDVFISYSHFDKRWVNDILVPRLEKEKLTICLDTRTFKIGTPSIINIENAVKQSRSTLLVLTPDWAESQWTAFEGLLLQTKDPINFQGRLLPLLVRECVIPERLRIFTYLDLRDPAEFESQMPRLFAAIRNAGAEPVQTTSAGQLSLAYERGLARLAEIVGKGETRAMLELALLEAQLRANLKQGQLEDEGAGLRAERAHLLADLDRLAVAKAGVGVEVLGK